MSVKQYSSGSLNLIAGRCPMDNALSTTSTNGVQNKVVTAAINEINDNLSVSVHSGIIEIPQIDSVTCSVNINLTDYYGIDDATAQNTFIFVQTIGDYNNIAYQWVSDVQVLNATTAQVLLRATSGATIPSGANMYAYISVHHVR